MAKGAQKRVASANASALSTLSYGFLVSNTIHLVANFWLWRSPATTHWRPILLYVVTELVAGGLGLQLASMARAGDDLQLGGLTAYVLWLTAGTCLMWCTLHGLCIFQPRSSRVISGGHTCW